jgi:hypothetical protein
MNIIRHLPKQLIMAEPALWGRVKPRSNTPLLCILPNGSLVLQPKINPMSYTYWKSAGTIRWTKFVANQWWVVLYIYKKTFESKKARNVSHCGLAIYIKKYLKAKEELCKLKYFTMQTYNLQKKSSKRNQNHSSYYNSISNLMFQHKPKYHLSKILI